MSFCSLPLQLFLSPILLPTGSFLLTALSPRALSCSSCGRASQKPVQRAVPDGTFCSSSRRPLRAQDRRVQSHRVGEAGHLSGGSRAQTTHSFRRGHPADGNCWSLEWSQRVGDERLPGLLMNHSPRRHLGPLQHKLYLHLLKALGWFIEAAVLSLPTPQGNVTVNICLGGMHPADEGLFCSQRGTTPPS